MSDAAEVRALIAEARAWEDNEASWGDNGLVTRLRDALEAAHAETDARVPVSREKLTAWLTVWLDDDMAHDASFELAEKWDIYPKADRKPAGSSKGDERG